jgi:hypothetical protein
MSQPAATAMIEVESATVERVVIIRFRGVVTNREFVDLAGAIAIFGLKGSVPIYLDWQRINRWAFRTPETADLSVWGDAGKIIERAAIVHGPRLNRQAAWLAAVLRSEGVQVRSWRPHEAAAAAAWLRQP